MKTVQQTAPTPRPAKRKGRYASEQEALDAKRSHLLVVLKDIDLKKLVLQ